MTGPRTKSQPDATRSLIWFFRDKEPEDPYRAAFESAGFQTRHIPVLRFEFESRWEPVPAVDAVVLTSRRAAEALLRSPQNNGLLPPGARKLPWYAIGPSTTGALEALDVPVQNGNLHTAADLAKTILERRHGSVAFFAGEPHRYELPVTLERAGVNVEMRIVYRSVPALDEPLDGGPPPEWAVFFSPRGTDLVADVPGPDWRSVRVAAIGPTTAAAVRKRGWNLAATSAAADAASLLSAVRNAVSESTTSSTNL